MTHSSLPLNPETPARPTPAAPPGRRVVDAPTRAFHWLGLLCLVGAYASAEGERWRQLHITLGYSLAGLLAFRVLWGVIGPRHARLASFGARLRPLGAWCTAALRGHIVLRPLQHLVMAASVVGLLVAMALAPLSGWWLYEVAQDTRWEHLAEGVHEFAGNSLGALALVHAAWVLISSLWRRQNLAAPMWSGRVAGRGPDLARHAHGGVAALLVLALLGFWSWQWHTAPQAVTAIDFKAVPRDHDD